MATDDDLFGTLSFFDSVALAAGILPGDFWTTCDARSWGCCPLLLQHTGLRPTPLNGEYR